jgi:glycosyltransferase involved in cell wall biosynthesis
MLNNNIKLSIIIPSYNEKNTLFEILERKNIITSIKKKIIIVDDSSTDVTTEIIKKLKKDIYNKVHFNEKIKGKDYAIRIGLKEATGDYILIQDADLECDPNNYIKLIELFIKFNADVVYRTRFLGGRGAERLIYFWNYVANKILTIFCNIYNNINIMSDVETCCKVFKKNTIKVEELIKDLFGYEPEITTKLAKKKLKFFDVNISYNGRSYEERKKIRPKMYSEHSIAF